jgi:hypothetical protein
MIYTNKHASILFIPQKASPTASPDQHTGTSNVSPRQASWGTYQTRQAFTGIIGWPTLHPKACPNSGIFCTTPLIDMELSSQPNTEVTLSGGTIRWPGAFSMVGATAFHAIQNLYFDKVFIGATGIHPERGLTVIESDEALILCEMVKHERQVITGADSSKLGMISPHKV